MEISTRSEILLEQIRDALVNQAGMMDEIASSIRMLEGTLGRVNSTLELIQTYLAQLVTSR